MRLLDGRLPQRSRSASYYYSHAMASHSRYASTRARGSAISPWVKADEDWTKSYCSGIFCSTVLNYPELTSVPEKAPQAGSGEGKGKRRRKGGIEDLARPAGLSSASTEQQHWQSMVRESSNHNVSQNPHDVSPDMIPLDRPASLFDSLRHLPVSSPPALSHFTNTPTTFYFDRECHRHPDHTVHQKSL